MTLAYNGILPGRTLISGVGSALVDLLAMVSEEELARVGAVKGGMTLVDGPDIVSALQLFSSDVARVPGGAACNSIIGVSRLGGPARFVGKCGKDETGAFFSEAVTRSGVEAILQRSDSPTGRVLSMITPDAQRTMITHLGAAQELQPDEITASSFQDSAVVLIEGYLLFNADLMKRAIAQAKSSGARIALDLASFTVVDACRGALMDIVRHDVDILLANEDEARAFTGSSDEEEALRQMAGEVEVAVLKIGSRGSLIACGGEVVRVPADGDGGAIDTTGAGDLWAAGFLYGIVNHYSLADSGKIGSACGYEVCQVMGAHIPEEGWERIRMRVKSLGGN